MKFKTIDDLDFDFICTYFEEFGIPFEAIEEINKYYQIFPAPSEKEIDRLAIRLRRIYKLDSKQINIVHSLLEF